MKNEVILLLLSTFILFTSCSQEQKKVSSPEPQESSSYYTQAAAQIRSTQATRVQETTSVDMNDLASQAKEVVVRPHPLQMQRRLEEGITTYRNDLNADGATIVVNPKEDQLNTSSRHTSKSAEITQAEKIIARSINSSTQVGEYGEKSSTSLAYPSTHRSKPAIKKQCMGLIMGGVRCERITSYASGYCWQHGKNTSNEFQPVVPPDSIPTDSVRTDSVRTDSISTTSEMIDQCTRATLRGSRCRRKAKEGSSYCWLHKQMYEKE